MQPAPPRRDAASHSTPWRTATVAALLLLALLATVTVADPPGGDPDRQATYVGTTVVEHELNDACAQAHDEILGGHECPLSIPQGVFTAVCDHEEGHPWTLGLYHGIGGVRFCSIPMSTTEDIQTIRLRYQESTLVEPEGLVVCPGEPQGFWPDPHLGRLSGDGWMTFTVPWWCDQTDAGDDATGPDHTMIVVFNLRAVEGSIQLQIV